MFDPRDPYERYWWHYESRRPLSVAQIISLHSVDPETAALVWLLLEYGSSLTVAGPTDPQPGVGKTTTLNALLQFLPQGTALAYMSGMYEEFAFTNIEDIDPATTYAICNEVSDHLPIYMWGRVARRYLRLPSQGYHIATSVHADTIDDVTQMYLNDLKLNANDLSRLGLVINIGLVGRAYPPRRKWFTTHFLPPQADPKNPVPVTPLPISIWNELDNTFIHADQATLAKLAEWVKVPAAEFSAALQRRTECLRELAASGADMQAMFDAIADVRKQEQKAKP